MPCLYFVQSTTAQAADPACASDNCSRILLCPEAHQEFSCKTKFTDLAESLLLQGKKHILALQHEGRARTRPKLGITSYGKAEDRRNARCGRRGHMGIERHWQSPVEPGLLYPR